MFFNVARKATDHPAIAAQFAAITERITLMPLTMSVINVNAS